MVQLEESYSCMLKGLHPCVVVSNWKACECSPIIQIIPISSKPKSMPMHVELDTDCGLSKNSICLVEQLTTINKNSLKYQLGKVNLGKMTEIESSILKQLGITNNYNMDMFVKVKSYLDEIEELDRFLKNRDNKIVEEEREQLVKDLERYCINHSIRVDTSYLKQKRGVVKDEKAV